MSDFVHLHVHSEYSLLDGLCRLPDLAARVAELGMPAVAVTDHGNLFGAVAFTQACVQAGVQPLLGAEIEVGAAGAPHRLVLLATSAAGYRNLMRLVSLPHLGGLESAEGAAVAAVAQASPGVTAVLNMADLHRYRDGLVVLTGYRRGALTALLEHGQEEGARQRLATLIDLFGRPNLYVEVQDHGLPAQVALNRRLAALADAAGVGLAATVDVHYLHAHQAHLQEVLLAIGAGCAITDPARPRLPTPSHYLKSAAEMAATFAHRPDALQSTVAIAAACSFTLTGGPPLLPAFPTPAGETPAQYLRALCASAVPVRYPRADAAVGQRLEHELQVIIQMGYASYFLIVWDFVQYARSQGIPVGPGRGSGAGSLVAYLLGITDVDPLAFGLLFERFLNPSRVDLPDFDIDFCYERRDEVIQYVARRYGSERVAQIITFGTLAARAAVRDVGRALGLPPADIDRLARRLPAGQTLDQALADQAEVRDLVGAHPRLQELVQVARGLEGLPRHASTHAAGVVIAPGPLVEYVPVFGTAEGTLVTQFDMDALKEIGLLKMDFLGLRTLTVIERAAAYVRRRQPDFDLAAVPLDDAATYATLARGQSLGVFQLEQNWVADVLRQIRPRRFADIVATISLCRPGPMQYIPDYVQARKLGAHIAHPDLEPILAETHGIMVYQEQVMQVAERVAGFTLAEADLLRRAVGKKRREELASYQQRFISGAVARGYDSELAEQLYADILRFAGYGFNRAHAVAYAVLAYRTAYLKRHWPAEYMAALITSVAFSEDKVTQYVAECRRLGVGVLPGDVNSGYAHFAPEPPGTGAATGAVRCGLTAIRNVGRQTVDEIVAEREQGGPFRSLTDLCTRVESRHLNRKALEALIREGACDSLGDRARLLAEMDAALGAAAARQRLSRQGQLTLFAEGPAAPAVSSVAVPVAAAPPVAGVLYLRLPVPSLNNPLLDQVRALLAMAPGSSAVRVKLSSGRWVQAEDTWRVSPVPALLQSLKELLGNENVVVR